MNSFLRVALLWGALTSGAVGQRPTPACGTPSPTPAQYQQLVRQVRSRAQSRTAIGPLMLLPIKFHVVRRSDGTGNETSLADINRALYWLNEQLAPANLQFYLAGSGINYIHNTDDFNDLSRQTGSYAIKNGVRNAINVFVFDQLDGGWAGFAYYPAQIQFTNCVFLKSWSLRHQPELLPHEIGHYFNLLHTHEGNSLGTPAERVDGSNCQITGDLVCDTPADPYGLPGATNNQCTYTGTALDAAARPFAPDLRNVMGYWHVAGCRTDRLTLGQYERLYEGYRMRLGGAEYNFDERPADLAGPAVRVERPNATTAALYWQDVSGALGYLVERADAPGGPWRVVQGLAPGVGTYTDGSRPTNRPQYYRLRASNSLRYGAVAEWRTQQSQQVAFETLPMRTFGDTPVALRATSSAGLPVQFRVKTGPGEIINGNQLKINGAGTIRVEAYQPGTGEYTAASAEQTCVIDRAGQTVSVDPVPDKTFGDAAFDLSARSNRGLPVLIDVVAGPGTALGMRVRLTGAGTLRLRAYQPGTPDYHSAEATLTLTVQKAAQLLTFEALTARTFGDPPVELRAQSSGGLPVSFGVEGPATVSGTRLHVQGAGTVRVTARQPGNDNYHAAPERTHVFEVAKARQALTFAPLPDRVYGQPAVALAAQSSAGLRPTYQVTGAGRLVDGDLVQPTGAGEITVVATQPGDANHHPAEAQSRSFRVAKAPQQISFDPLPNRTYGDAPFPVAAGVNSALGVQLSVMGPARLEGTLLTITGAGEVAVVAAQPGDDNHHPAGSVTQRFVVDKRRQLIAWTDWPDRMYTPEPLRLEATSNTGRAVEYRVSGEAQLTADQRLRLLRAGTVTLRAGVAGDANHYPADTLTRAFRVERAPQTVTTTLADWTLGPTLTHDLPARGTEHLALRYTLLDGPVTLAGTVLTATDYGRVTLRVEQDGDDRYLPAPAVERTFCLNPTVPTITPDPRYELILVSSSPFRNQWLLNGDTLRGATGTRYELNRPGTYTVSVANPVGTCASRAVSAPREVVISSVAEAALIGFDVFPNPSAGAVRVRVSGPMAAVPTLALHDAAGRVVGQPPLHKTAPGTFEADLALERLTPGTYLLRVQTGKQGLTKRVVVR
jgi:hypothetical protein